MGVPAFFRWLSRKYPSVVASCVEIRAVDDNGRPIAPDPSEPNPNGVEFDNLYLDMNGIIHPCTHPEDKPAPKNEDEMMIAIFECIDRMLNIVRPRKLLYMAVDGVAPQAKMNQQRSRRFRACKESGEKAREIEQIRAKLTANGVLLPPPKDPESHFDSNCITPGTPFMARLSKCLHYYAHTRLNNNPAWKHLTIILSDANVPGEGEHKIMDFIRKQRGQPDHDPNTRHCLCGADADLIMLGLATHEPNFTIIREEFRPNQDRPCDVCGKLGHEMNECTGLDSDEQVIPKVYSDMEYLFVRLNVLREYLKRELSMPNLPFTYDFERVVDDWVFMCFFVGNDFLPHLPSLEIREGAIDRLVNLYKNCVYKTGGYLTDNGRVTLNRVQLIMSDLGVVEDQIFQKRQHSDQMYRSREKQKKKRLKMMKTSQRPTHVLSGQYTPIAVGSGGNTISNPRQELYQQRVQSMHTSANGVQGGEKRKLEGDSDEDDEPADEVRLWEAGFKDRYYESKFDIKPENKEFRYRVAFEYVRGLCWVLRYYYQGCASWKWFFPYHYAPFASDFVNIAESPVEFEKGTKAVRPLEQLMRVFPAGSKSHVPEPWGELMESPDSTIIDIYPTDFKIDLNGQKAAWRGVALLPFVDENRLMKALEKYYPLLTEEERVRNTLGDDRLYVGANNSNYTFLRGLYENSKNFDDESATLVGRISCRVVLAKDCINHGATLVAPVRSLDMVSNNQVVCVRYRDPKYSEDHIFPSTRLPGAEDPPTVLKPKGLDDSSNWRPMIGMAKRTQIASVGVAGHRMLNREVATYGNVPPPTAGNYYDRRNGTSFSERGGREQSGYNSFSNYNSGRSGGDYSNRGYVDRETARFGGGYNQRPDNRRSGGGSGGYNQRPGSRNNEIDRETAQFGGGYNQGQYQRNYRSGSDSQRDQQNDQYRRYQPNTQSGGPRPRYCNSTNFGQNNFYRR